MHEPVNSYTSTGPAAHRMRCASPRSSYSIRRARITVRPPFSVLARTKGKPGAAPRLPLQIPNADPWRHWHRLAQPLILIGARPPPGAKAGTSTPAPTWTAKSTLLPCASDGQESAPSQLSLSELGGQVAARWLCATGSEAQCHRASGVALTRPRGVRSLVVLSNHEDIE